MLLVGATLLEFYVAARAVGVVLPWSQLLWLGPLILVAASVPSFFGGWGIREGASALLFASAGLPQSTGVAVSVIFGVFTLVVSLPGILVLFFDADRTRAADSTPWHDAHALSLCVGTCVALWAHYPPLLAFVSALCFLILVARSWGRWTPGGRFGAPNMVTSLRLFMTLGLLMGYERQPNRVVAACALLILLLDVLDGWLARRMRQISEFGAHFDVEADAMLVLTLSMVLFTARIAGPWVLLAGLWRYIYVLAPAVAPTPHGEAKRSRLGRLLYVLMMGCFVGALTTPAGLAVKLAAIGTLAVSISFLRSFWQRYVPMGVSSLA
jgi:phosphatidylglycerophosphate synthase